MHFRFITFNVKVLLLFLTLLMTACSTTTNYKDVEDEERARLRFATTDQTKGTFMDGGPNITVRQYDDMECNGEKHWTSLRNGPLIGSSGKRLNIPLFSYHKNAAKEFYVATSKPLVLMFDMADTQSTGAYNVINNCGVMVNITLEKNKDYELLFTQPKRTSLSADRRTTCHVDYNEIINANGMPEKKLIKKFYNSVAPTSRECIRLFEKERW